MPQLSLCPSTVICLTGLRRTIALTAVLTTALTATACGSDDAGDGPAVVTVTATAGEDAQAQDAGPNPTGAGQAPDQAPAPNPDTASGAAPTGGQQSAPEDVAASGQMVLTGTVVDMTTSEIMDISETAPGSPPPNGEPETNGYIVLKLDRPQQITARHSGMSGQTAERTVRYVSLSTPNGSESSINWTGYVGKHVTVTTTAEGMWFPSDTGLPLGMVRLSEGTVK